MFIFKEFDFSKVTEWLESDEEKSELLKFIDEMKSMSKTKSSRTNPLLIRPTNSSDKSNNNTSYDELLLFDEILSAEINKTMAKQDKIDRINQTTRIITSNSHQAPHWNSEPQAADKVEETVIRPVPKEPTPESFDPQKLIERIRKTYRATNVTSNYELLTCKSQSFLQRLAVLGEILT